VRKKAADTELSMEDIARTLGISITTVSRALSGKGRISTATRKRVLEYAETVQYSPNKFARALSGSRTFNIGVVIPGDAKMEEMSFFQDCLQGITEEGARNDYDILLIYTWGEDIRQLRKVISSGKVDGVIITRAVREDPAVCLLEETGLPYVVIGSKNEKKIIQGCCEMTGSLLDRGIKRLALIGGDIRHEVTISRYKGFKKAFWQRGLRPQENIVLLKTLNREMAEEAVDYAIRGKAEGILCMDDCICRYVFQKLDRSSCRVPGDIKLASFYDNSLLVHHNPSITAIHFCDEERGRYECLELINRMEGREMKTVPEVKYELIFRESTDNCKGGN
jgi:putative catabolite control protein A